MTAAAWPKTLEIPSGAVSQWRALREALAVREPPCAADPEVWHSRNIVDRNPGSNRSARGAGS